MRLSQMLRRKWRNRRIAWGFSFLVYYKSRRSNDCIMPQAFTSSKYPVDFDHSKNMFQYIYKLPIPFALTTPDNRLGIKCLPNSNMICIAIYLYAHLFKLQSNGRGHLSLKDKSTFLQNFLSNPNRYVYTVEGAILIWEKKPTFFGRQSGRLLSRS